MRPSKLVMMLLTLLCAAAIGTSLAAYDHDLYVPDGNEGGLPDLVDDPVVESSDNRVMLGVQMSPPSRRVIEEQGLDAHTGVFVHRVYEDTAAAALGIERGDVITAINGRPISSMSDLREIVMSSQEGDPVEVTISRDGEQETLGGASYREWPESIPYRPLDPAAEERYRELQQRRLGQQMKNLDRLADQADQLRERLDEAESFDDLAQELGVDPEDFLDAMDTPKLADGTEPTMFPKALLAVPGWAFRYGFEVRDSAAPVTKAEKVEINMPEMAEISSTRLTYRFHVSSELL